MKIQKTRILIAASFVLLFSVFAYRYLASNLWDYDFWWHVATGRYIVQQHSLPQSDPFCFPSSLAENKSLYPKREAFILKQYWLAQVLFYLVFEKTGNTGIILLRGAIVLSVIFLVSYALYRKKTKFYVSFVITFLAYLGTVPASGERPVLFTILFCVVAFLLLDDYKEKRGWKLILLIPVMLLWANLHGGFVLGDVIIIAFAIGETINMVRHSAYTPEEMKRFLLISAAAVAASFVNPSGMEAFFIAFSPKYKIFTDGVQEYAAPFFLYINKLYPVSYAYVALIFLFPVVLALRRKKFDITYLIILGGLCYESLQSIRFGVYYVVIGGIILGSEVSKVIEKLFDDHLSVESREKIERSFAVILFVSAVLYTAGVKFEKPRFQQARSISVPVGAVDFMQKNGIKGRIFNDCGSGGYLEWRLYPKDKTFIDTRAINAIQIQEYSFIGDAYYSTKSMEKPANAGENKSELWDRLLDHYDVNVIFLSPLDVYGTVPRLLLRLAESDKWVPIYSDAMSIVYVRNSKANRKIIERFRKKKEVVFDTVIARAASYARGSSNPYFFLSLGDIFREMGRLEDAVKAYRYSYARKADPALLQSIEKLEKEIKQKEREKAGDFSDNKMKS